MLNQPLKELDRPPDPAAGADAGPVHRRRTGTPCVKDHRTRARHALPGLSRHLLDRHEPPRPAGALRRDEPPRRLGLRAGLRPAGRHGAAAPRARPAALQPGDLHAAGGSSTCSASRCSTTCATRNVLTMLDLGGIPLAADERTLDASAGDRRRPVRGEPRADGPLHRPVRDRRRRGGAARGVRRCGCELKQSGGDREAMLAEMAARLPYVYVPRFYEPQYDAATAGRGRCGRLRADVPAHDRAGRGRRPRRRPAAHARRSCRTSSACTTASPSRSCAAARAGAASARARRSSGRCGSARSRRSSQAALETYRNTGYNEISLLSLSTSDYPHFDELMRRLQETFRPLGVSISLPSLRINEQLRLGRRPDEHRPPRRA